MKMNLRERASRLKRDVPAVFLALKDPATPLRAKLLAWVTVGYALSPIDLIPDFIPVLGYLDDVLILPALVALTVRCIPADVWERSRAAADRQMSQPKRWYYAVPVVCLWLVILWLIVRAVRR